MFDVDAALDSRRAVREACSGALMACEQASAGPVGSPRPVRRLSADRVLWSRGEVIALRRRRGERSADL
jgi:hypothetical protein